MITVHTLATNLVHGPKWLVEPVAGFGTFDPLQEKMVQYADKVLPPKFNLSFQPFWLHQTKVEVFYGFVQYGATGAEIKSARLYFVFTNPSGVTNVYHGKEAGKFLSRYQHGVAENKNHAVLVLRLDDEKDSNEIHTVERVGGIIRTNQLPK
jgi:hypothetical protein